MKTREEIQSEIACLSGQPLVVQGAANDTLTVYPPSVGLMLALRALGNTLAASIDDPSLCEHVTQEDTLIFYWAICTPPAEARKWLSQALASGDKAALLAAASDFAWLLVPSVVASLNEALKRTRSQVEAVTVSIIPDAHTEKSSKN